MTQSVFYPSLIDFFILLSLKKKPITSWSNTQTKLCTEIIRIGNFCVIFTEEIIYVEQHQMSKTKFKVDIKVLSKLLLI